MRVKLFANKIITDCRCAYKTIISGLFILFTIIAYSYFFFGIITNNALFARTERGYYNRCEDYFFHTTNV
jgi:hypothetical protein